MTSKYARTASQKSDSWVIDHLWIRRYRSSDTPSPVVRVPRSTLRCSATQVANPKSWVSCGLLGRQVSAGVFDFIITDPSTRVELINLPHRVTNLQNWLQPFHATYLVTIYNQFP